MSSYRKVREEMLKKYGATNKDENPNVSSKPAATGGSSRKVREEMLAKYAPTVTVDSNYINEYLRDADSYFNSASTDYENMGFGNTSKASYEQRRNSTYDLRSRGSNIVNYLENNKGSIDAETYNALKSQVNNINTNISSILYSFQQANDVYSQYKSEDEYNQAVAKAKEFHDNWGHYADAEDFDEVSANRKFTNPTRENLDYFTQMMDTSQWYWDADGNRYDTFGNKIDMKNVDDRNIVIHPLANDERYAIKDRYGMWANATEDDRRQATAMREVSGSSDYWSNAILDGDSLHWEQLTNDELGIYYYLLNTEGTSAANEFLDYMEVELAKRHTIGRNTFNAARYKDSGLLEKIALNAVSVPVNVLGGFSGFLDDMSRTMKGEEINPYSDAHAGMHFTNTIRGLTAEDLDKTGFNIPIVDYSLGDIYQVGMSRLDSAFATWLGGGAGTVLLGMGAATNEAYRLYEQGASPEQITWGALLAGAAETVFEYASFDKLINMKDAKTVGQWVKNALIQGGVEASEEAFTELSNLITNNIVMKDDSDWAKLLVENGGSERGAFLSAFKQVSQSAFGGFLGGFGAGATQGGKTYINTQKQHSAVGNTIMGVDGGVAALKDLANEVAGVSDVNMQKALNKQAENVSTDVASGKGLGKAVAAVKNANNATNVGRLYSTVQEANNLSNAPANQADISKSLQRKGFNTETANDIAEALVASYNGQDLTKAQRKLLKSVENSQVVKNAVANIVANEKSTMGQRNQNIRDFSRKVELGAISKESGIPKETLKDKVAADVESGTESQYEVSEDGRVVDSSGSDITITGVKSVGDGKMVLQTESGSIDADDVRFASEDEALLYSAISNMGATPETAWYLIERFKATDGASAQAYATFIPLAYKYGKLNYRAGLTNIPLPDSQKLAAFFYGRNDAEAEVKAKIVEKSASTAKSSKTTVSNQSAKKGGVAHKKGVVKGDGVSIADLQKRFNDTQKKAYKYLSTVAEVTGIDIVLYQSKPNAQGKYTGAQGKYKRNDPGTIYIDLNAGLTDVRSADDLAKYAMLRTFAHEFTHFIENLNPIQYNEFRKVVFDTLEARGESKDALIKDKMARNPGMDPEQASREVVAEAMTDILPDTNFVQELAEKHKTIFQKLLDHLKEFVENLSNYFNSIGQNPSREANALKEQGRYLEEIVAQFDKIAMEAVENYQTATTENQEVEQPDTVQEQSREYLNDGDIRDDIYYPRNKRDAQAFLRSFANKTSSMQNGEAKNVLVFTKDHAYFVTATGYLKGDIDSVYRILGNEQLIENVWREFDNGSDRSGETYSSWLKDYWSRQERRSGDTTGTERSYAAREIAGLDGQESGDSDTVGSYWGNYGYSSWEELREAVESGAMVMDENGDILTIEQFQQRTDTLTDRDILAMAKRDGLIENLSKKDQNVAGILLNKGEALGDLQGKKAEQERILGELQQKSPKNHTEITKAKNRIKIYEDQIAKASAELRELEDIENAKVLLEKVRPAVERKLIAERKAELAKYGTIPQGEKAVRKSALPKSTDGENKVSRTARTVYEAGVTPEDFAELVDKEVYLKNGLSYVPVSNNDVTQKAIDYIQEEGWEAARGSWSAEVRRGKVSAELSAIGALLLNNAAKAGDKRTWLDILHDYQIMSTNAGQAVQALSILKTLTPDDSLYMVHKDINQMVKDLRLKRKIQVDAELETAYLAAQTDEERDHIMAQIQQDVADQIPATFRDKWTSLRYLNMLGNLRTQGRNLAGNAVMGVTVELKNLVATGLEAIASISTGGKYKKNKAFLTDKETLSAAFADYAVAKSIVSNGGKYNDQLVGSSDFAQGVMEKRKIFKSKVLEKYRKATNWAMENGDVPFSKYAYARALAGYLKQHGFKGSDLSKTDAKLLEEARQYAVQEAQEATFHDLNMLSKWVIKVGRRKDTPAAVRVIADGAAPFRQTVANIAVRAEEYSPLGFVNSLYYTVQAARTESDITPQQAINSWAKTLTGSTLFLLGSFLAASDNLIGAPDDDEDKDQFEQMYGQQNYALKFGDTYITIDWASPAAIPLLMGAQFYKLKEENGFQFKDITGALSSLADPLIEMSMLQGINDTLEKVKYSDNNLIQIAINTSLSYLTQGLTNSLVGQLERAFEDSRMSTYVDENSQLPDWLQQHMGKISAKTPVWDYSQIPYIDAWGEEQENPNLLTNMAYNMLSPSYIGNGKEDSVYKELVRLDDAQSDKNVFPSTPSKKYEGRYLSAEEYVALAKAQGQTQRKLVEEIIATEEYKAMNDINKAKTISFAYKYAKEKAQIDVLGREEFSAKWLNDIKGNATQAIIQHVLEQ